MSEKEGIAWEELNRQAGLGREFIPVETIRAGQIAAKALSHPLEVYRNNDSITENQYDAGMRLYNDFHRSLAKPASMSFDGVPAPTTYFSRSINDTQLDASISFQNALRSVGKRLSLPLTTIVILERTLEQYGQSIGRSRRTAKRHLIDALDLLASHYHLTSAR